MWCHELRCRRIVVAPAPDLPREIGHATSAIAMLLGQPVRVDAKLHGPPGLREGSIRGKRAGDAPSGWAQHSGGCPVRHPSCVGLPDRDGLLPVGSASSRATRLPLLSSLNRRRSDRERFDSHHFERWAPRDRLVHPDPLEEISACSTQSCENGKWRRAREPVHVTVGGSLPRSPVASRLVVDPFTLEHPPVFSLAICPTGLRSFVQSNGVQQLRVEELTICSYRSARPPANQIHQRPDVASGGDEDVRRRVLDHPLMALTENDRLIQRTHQSRPFALIGMGLQRETVHPEHRPSAEGLRQRGVLPGTPLDEHHPTPTSTTRGHPGSIPSRTLCTALG